MKYLFAMFIILSGICIWAAEKIDLEPADPYFNINNSSTAGFSLEMAFSGVSSESVTSEVGGFSKLSIPGFAATKALGEPELPVLRKIFTAPAGAEINIDLIDYSETELTLSKFDIYDPLYPAQPSVSKSQDPDDLEFIQDEAAYSQEGYANKPLITVEEAGSVRGTRLLVLNIEPIRYDPVNAKILVINEITAEISFSSSVISADTYNREKAVSHHFTSTLKRTVINYPLYETRDELTNYPVKYVIVADPLFEDQLQPFIDWKIQKGINVIEAYVGDPEVGTTNLSIKAFLQELYDNATPDDPAPSFLLIVGDIDQVPAWDGNTGGHVTDLNYVKLDGNNYVPDMYFGRFSANDPDQLQPQIDKTLEYEKYLLPDPSYLENVVMIAGVDANFAPTHGNGQINYGTSYYFNEEHGLNSYTYLYPESGSSDGAIIQNVSDGVSYINYTAHGYDQGWGDPTFTNNDVNSLQNFNEYCLAVGNCCLTNKFDVATCFGEAWLRVENKGAIGYIGGTNSTYWNEDYWWGVGAGNVNSNPSYEATGRGVYDGLFHANDEPFADWFTTSASINFCGNMAVVEGNGADSYYWEIYALMGDPSLEVYLGVPEENVVSFPDVIILGQESIEISAEPYSYAALTREGEIIGTVLIDASGSSELELGNVTQPGTATLVITKQNRQPVIAEIDMIPDGSYVVVSSFEINDGDNGLADYGETFFLDVTLFNAGNLASGELTIMVTTEDAELNITNGSFAVDNLEADDYLTIEEAIELQLSGSVPDQHEAELMFWISGVDTWQSEVQFTCNAPELTSGSLQVTGDDNGAFDPGETVQVQIPVANIGHAMSEAIEAQLICLTSDVLEVTDPVAELTGLASGEEALAEFTVAVDEGLDPGTPVEFIFQAFSGEYSIMSEYISSIGNVVENFESGDLLSFPWMQEGDSEWAISETAFEGSYAAASGAINDNEESSLKIEFSIPVDGYLSFWKKVSSQADSDIFSFNLNGEVMAAWSGENDWSQEIFEIPAGDHLLEWKYAKDQNSAAGSDTAWLDQIVFPSAGITFPPMLAVIPQELNIELTDTDLYETTIQVRNIGGEELTFTALVPGTLDWLTLSEYSGTLTSGSIAELAVYIDATGLENGEHTGAVMFNCDVADFVILPVSLLISDTGSEDEILARTELLGNYPNPFNPTTEIKFSLTAKDAKIAKLNIFNIKGHRIIDISSKLLALSSRAESRDEGQGGKTYTIVWEGTDNNGNPVPSGIYFYRLQAGDYTATRKMLLLK